MEIDFLELLKYIESKKDGAIYEKFISQIRMLKSYPEKELEIIVPTELIKEFVRFKEDFD